MKKRMIALSLLLCLLAISGCGREKNNEPVKTYTNIGWTDRDAYLQSNTDECAFEAQYIRAGSNREDIEYPAVKLIRTAEELDSYLENETYMSENLLEACRKYDEAYFDRQLLVMVLLEEGSGSIRHTVKSVGLVDSEMVIDIETIVPEVGTADMAWWHILIEPEAGIEAAGEEEVVVFLDGNNATDKVNVVSHSKGYASISLQLPDGWEHEITDDENSTDFSISIYPTDNAQSKIRIGYFGGFGVCGTGLKQEKIQLGRYEAWQGTYDNNTVWEFITLIGTPGDYAILNEAGPDWWNTYGDDAMQILATLNVADGFITESEAVQIAKAKADVLFDSTYASFDEDNGTWTVALYREYVGGGDQIITIDVYGNVTDISYNE